MIRHSVMLFLMVTMIVLPLVATSPRPSILSSPSPTPTVQVTAQIFMPSIGTGAHPEDTAARSPLIPRPTQRWMGRYGSLILLLLALAALALLRRSKRAS
jgi:hypothetical protein